MSEGDVVKVASVIKDLDINDIIKFTILKIIDRYGTRDFVVYVSALESLMMDELDQDYFNKIEEESRRLEEEIGTKDMEMYSTAISEFKFIELLKRIKRSIPRMTIGEL